MTVMVAKTTTVMARAKAKTIHRPIVSFLLAIGPSP
jgi:hypothetical protein